MKFAVFALLFSTASAMRLTHQPKHLVKTHHSPVHSITKFLKLKDGPDDEMSGGEEDEVEAWAKSELADGGTITGPEAVEFFGAYAKKVGYKMKPEDWAWLGYMFGQADTDHNGELDAAEVQAAMGSDIKMPKKLFKKLLKSKIGDPSDDEMSEGEEDEVEAWAKSELADGGTITGPEAVDFFGAYAKKVGYKMKPEDWAWLGYMFGQMDTNHDGELDAAEVQAAMGSDIKVPKKLFKKLIKVKLGEGPDDGEMSGGEEDEVEAWAKSELADGGTITGPEAVDFFGAYAKKHGYKMQPEDWAWLGYMFGQMDTNHDGQLDAQEVMAAMGSDEIKVPAKYLKKLMKVKGKRG